MSTGFLIWLSVLSWTPSSGALQLIAYVGVPLSVTVWTIVTKSRVSLPVLLLFAALATLATLSMLAEGDAVALPNALLAVLTYGSLAILLVRAPYDARCYGRLVTALSVLTVVQVLIAVVQFVDANRSLRFVSMAAGDAAVGTLLTNSHLFSVKMLVLVAVFAVAAILRVHRRAAVTGLLAALIGVVLSSALLSTVLGLAAVCVVAFALPSRFIGARLRTPLWRLRIAATAIAIIGGALFLLSQPANVRYIQGTFSGLARIAMGESERPLPGKVNATIDSAAYMFDDAKVLLIGTGPGHYSSRAALILSGGYLAPHPSMVPVSLSTHTDTMILPRWNPGVWSVQYQDGVMNQPFHSIQSIVVEFGLIGSLLVLFGYGWAWRRVLGVRAPDARTAAVQLSGIVVLAMLPVLLLTDNWLEYPHAAVQMLVPVALALNLPGRRHAGSATG